MRKFLLLFFLLLVPATAQTPSFKVIVLGSEGGLSEGNLSSYLVASVGSQNYLALDAGTLLTGLKAAAGRGRLPPPSPGLTPEGSALRAIRGYLISHPHFDHIAGLVIDSPEDSSKPIVGLASTIDALRDHVFIDKVWANFGDEGARPIKKYQYQRVDPGVSFRVSGCPFDIEVLPLSHADCLSTAFILHADGAALVYCGDTGADAVEGGERMLTLWKKLAPLVRRHELKALFLEVSFPDGRSDQQLFGHLTPTWMMRELRRLANEIGGSSPLANLTVVVTHIKPSLAAGKTPKIMIEEQLARLNDLGVRFIYPEQGQALEF